jgi:hypothetical protein
MAIETLFKSTHASIKYIFKDGSTANFIHGKYSTANKKQIEELSAEVEARHPHILIDAQERTIDTEKVDPISKLKDKLRAEILDEMARQSNPLNDFGSSDQGNFSPASTMDIAAVSAGGDGSQLASRLANLVGKISPEKA